MRVRNSKPEGLDILGNQGVSAGFDGDWRFELLKKSSGYMSVVAGISIAMLGQVQDAPAKANGKVPPGVAQRALTALEQYKQSCSTPELLRSQAKFRLPNGGEGLELARTFAGGDACPGNAVPAGNYTVGSPYLDSGTTVGANNTVTSIQAGCSNYLTNPGPDHIYSFKISARAAAAQISMTTTTGTYDPSIYILNGTTGAMCPAGTANAVTNCLQGADDGVGGGGETITTAEVNTLPLNTQLYLFVDSFYSTGAGSGAYTVRFQDVTVPSAVALDANADFNGDGKTDFVVARGTASPRGTDVSSEIVNRSVAGLDERPKGRRNSENSENSANSPSAPPIYWYTALNGPGTITIQPWGDAATDFIVTEDFDGDGKDDLTVWREAPATQAAFYILQSQTSTVNIQLFGQTGDDPAIVGDYDGDNKADPAVYRCPAAAAPAGQCFFFYRGSLANPSGAVTYVPWGFGNDGNFFPLVGDFDGDNKNDFCIQRTNPAFAGKGQFLLLKSNGFGVEYVNWGLDTDFLIPGDYDGDGMSDFCIRRTVSGARQHWILERDGGQQSSVIWGITGDVSAPGDYDGDGKTDLAIWRPNADPTQNFFWVRNSNGGSVTQFEWGSQNDFAVAGWAVH
jgi:hypothetical protein